MIDIREHGGIYADGGGGGGGGAGSAKFGIDAILNDEGVLTIKSCIPGQPATLNHDLEIVPYMFDNPEHDANFMNGFRTDREGEYKNNKVIKHNSTVNKLVIYDELKQKLFVQPYILPNDFSFYYVSADFKFLTGYDKTYVLDEANNTYKEIANKKLFYVKDDIFLYDDADLVKLTKSGDGYIETPFAKIPDMSGGIRVPFKENDGDKYLYYLSRKKIVTISKSGAVSEEEDEELDFRASDTITQGAENVILTLGDASTDRVKRIGIISKNTRFTTESPYSKVIDLWPMMMRKYGMYEHENFVRRRSFAKISKNLILVSFDISQMDIQWFMVIRIDNESVKRNIVKNEQAHCILLFSKNSKSQEYEHCIGPYFSRTYSQSIEPTAHIFKMDFELNGWSGYNGFDASKTGSQTDLIATVK